MKIAAFTVAIICLPGLMSVSLAEDTDVPAHKRTKQGLYLTATEAYAKWKADPDSLKIIDVRTPEEYVFIGHPAMAWNVPLSFLKYEWDAGKKKPVMVVNPDFVEQVKAIAKPTDTIIVTCRSGNRSAPATNMLTDAGYKTVYHIVDGVEGDKVSDPASVFHGKRMKNGWKNSGLPWTYSLDPKLMYLQEQ